MLIPVPPSECMRAREAVSGRLDDELTELEVARLDVHLRRCPACREFAAASAAITAQLRRAPFERPAARTFEPRRRTRVSGLRLQAAAAAAIVVAATGSLMLGRMVGGGGDGPRFTASAPVDGLSSAREDATAQRLLALLPVKHRQMSTRNGPVVPL
jgi:predicted anti-sigma-YlaC factor YlaD